MLYLSQVLSRPIRDLDGERVATVKDVIVRLGEEEHPPVTGLVARYRRRDFFSRVGVSAISAKRERGSIQTSWICVPSAVGMVRFFSHATCSISN